MTDSAGAVGSDRRLFSTTSTGKRINIRGALCQNCNRGIGMLGDDIQGVRRALEYRHRYEARKPLTQLEALYELEKSTGTITSRSRSAVLQGLCDSDLIAVAVILKNKGYTGQGGGKMSPEQKEELPALAKAGGARLSELQNKFGQWPQWPSWVTRALVGLMISSRHG
jgi:hypothetical protein